MRLERYRFDGGTAVVTGAASGIGAALAMALADRGSNLCLIDRDGPRLMEVADEVSTRHPALEVNSYQADLSETEGLGALATRILDDVDAVTLLVNNAGVAMAGHFHELSLEDFDWLMRTNFAATVHLTHHLLPALRESPGAHLVNMSSVYGLIAPPGQSVYAASKFAIRGFTESLRHELPTLGIGVTSVHPGGVRTRIAENARLGAHLPLGDVRRRARREFSRLLTIEPRDAAEAILLAVERRRTRVLIGSSARIPDLIARLTPSHYWPAVATLVGLRMRAGHRLWSRLRRAPRSRD